MTKAPSLRDVRATLAEHAPGLTIRKEDCGEYRVTFTQEAIAAAFPNMDRVARIAKAEALASYESDIRDAYETAKAMYRTGLRADSTIEGLPAEPATAEAAPAAFIGETIDMTPTWAAVAPIFVACLEDGTETGRRSARLELNRMAGLADERNAFASTLASIREALDSCDTDLRALASTRGSNSVPAIERRDALRSAIRELLA